MAAAAVEEALKLTLAEVEAIKSQIHVIVSSLVANNEIAEMDLVPILDSRQNTSTSGSGKPSSLTSRLSLRRKSELRASQSQSEIKSTLQPPPPPRPTPFFEPTLELLEHETFLIPLLDRWIWGTTVINKSLSPIPLPVLHLIVPRQGKSNSTSVFTYNFTVSLVDMDISDSPHPHPGFDIPVLQTIQSKSIKKQLKAGDKAMITASFADPTSMYNSKGLLRIVAAIFSDEKLQLCRAVDIKTEHAFTRFNDSTYTKFRPQIFSALSQQCQESFKLERVRPDVSPLPALKKFLNTIGFETISTVQPDREVSLECLAYDVPSLLFGLFVKIESNSREYPIRCAVGARSLAQMKTFARMFSKWVRKESRPDSKDGLKISSLNPPTSQDLTNALSKELEVLTHLVIFMQHNLLDSDSSTRNWFYAFQQAMAHTDRLFMQKMRVKA